MQRPFTHHQMTFDILYHTYWGRIVRFCHKHLASLPDGTAEEVAQDVFLAAHRAIEQQRYRGDSAISTWLFGIAHHLCCKARRDTYRKTTSQTLRHLEREIARLEHEVTRLTRDSSPLAQRQADLVRDRLTLARAGLERERAQLQQHIMTSAHSAPPAPLDTPAAAADPLAVIQDSVQRLARRDRRMHALLHMHVVKEASVQEIAHLHGMSRSAVYRGLSRARTELRKVYQTATHEQ